MFRRYEQAADPAWEQFRDAGTGEGVHPSDVMGVIDLAGSDAAAEMLSRGAYDVVAYPHEEGVSVSVGDYFREDSSMYLEEEGFYAGTGYKYANRGEAPSTAVVSSIGTGPADITYAPTSTTNPARPRTVAAGWDSDRKVMTVIFRDGTFYNYYSVSGLEWNNFKRSRSKGKFIKTYLDAKPRGTAAVGMIPQAHRELLYKVARTSQVMKGGYTGKQKIGTKRGTGGKYAYGASGTSRSGGRVFRRSKM